MRGCPWHVLFTNGCAFCEGRKKWGAKRQYSIKYDDKDADPCGNWCIFEVMGEVMHAVTSGAKGEGLQ